MGGGHERRRRGLSLQALHTPLVILSAALWAATALLGSLGHGYAAMFLALVILLGYGVQGAARKGRLSGRFLVYPLLAWVALWAAAFLLARHYADLFAGRAPDFAIAGLHPSFAWTVLGYWVGGVITLAVGFVLFRDDWLTEEDWAEFKERVASDDDGEGDR